MIIPLCPVNDYMDIIVAPLSCHAHVIFYRGTKEQPFPDEASVCKKDLVVIRVTRGMALVVDPLLFHTMPRSYSSATTMSSNPQICNEALCCFTKCKYQLEDDPAHPPSYLSPDL